MYNGRAEIVVAVRRLMGMVVIVFIRVSMVVVMTVAVIMAVGMLMATATTSLWSGTATDSVRSTPTVWTLWPRTVRSCQCCWH